MTKTLNKEQIKAIRIVKGFTSDLRVKLTGVNEESIWYFTVRSYRKRTLL